MGRIATVHSGPDLVHHGHVRIDQFTFGSIRIDGETYAHDVVIDRGRVRRVLAVATSAVREAENGAHLIERVRKEAGVRVALVDGEAEARYAFPGAVYGVQAEPMTS